MNRRELLRNLVAISAGAAFFPYCARDEKRSLPDFRNIRVSREQADSMEALAEAIIPQTDSPGAKALGSHLYVLMMVDDCRTSKDQESFLRGLDQFTEMAAKRTGGSFARASASDQAALLADIEKNSNISPDMQAFYRTTKQLTVQHFTTSEYFLTKIQVYEMVPGRFHGCFPIKNISAHG